jgi:type I restriction enzyme R subunit
LRKVFQDYYRTAPLAEEADPNKLHDLKAALDAAPPESTVRERS